MQIQFTLPDSAAVLLKMSAERIELNTGAAQSLDDIARSIVLEVLIDDAEAHGIVQGGVRTS